MRLWAATGRRDRARRRRRGRAEPRRQRRALPRRRRRRHGVRGASRTAFAGRRDGGETWDDVSPPDLDVFSLAVSPVDGAVYAGTEPSRLFRSDDGGESWRALDALLELPSRPTWSFPPRPWTSHVRWIAPSPLDAELLLVGIELGGLMRSTDGGETWVDHAPGAQRDVHSWSGIRRAPVRTRREAAARPGATTAARRGSRPTRAATATTRGRWRPIRTTPRRGSSRPAPGRSRRTAAARRRRASSAAAASRPGRR